MVVMLKEKERRFLQATELRAVDNGDKEPTIEGYAAVFNSLSEEMYGFREMIAPGAFANCIATSDIRCLKNHNPDVVLGRISAKTLTVTEDEHGLFIRCIPPDTQEARDLQTSIKRGDINQMSFAFTIADDGDSWACADDGTVIRTINLFEEIFDVSPVTYPAYPETSVQARSIAQEKKSPIPKMVSTNKRKRLLLVEKEMQI